MVNSSRTFKKTVLFLTSFINLSCSSYGFSSIFSPLWNLPNAKRVFNELEYVVLPVGKDQVLLGISVFLMDCPCRKRVTRMRHPVVYCPNIDFAVASPSAAGVDGKGLAYLEMPVINFKMFFHVALDEEGTDIFVFQMCSLTFWS